MFEVGAHLAQVDDGNARHQPFSGIFDTPSILNLICNGGYCVIRDQLSEIWVM